MKLILVTCLLSTLVLSIQCRPQAVHFYPFQPQPQFLSPYLYAPNPNYPQPSPLVPYGGGAGPAGFFGDGTIQFIPAEAFAPHPFSRVPKMMDAELVPTQSTTTGGPIKLTAANEQFKPIRAAKLKQPKMVMNAPFIQAVQQSNDKFKIQKLELVHLKNSAAVKAKPYTVLKIQPAPAKTVLKLQPSAPLKEQLKMSPLKMAPLKLAQKSQAAPAKYRVPAPEKQVMVTATSKTAADQPISLPSGDPTYAYFGAPSTGNREESTLILEPSSKAISGNGGTAISTPVSHAVLKHGSSTKILFRPQSVAIVGANGLAHAQADLIVDYID